MTSAEIALALFALCNSVRVFAYVPQIIAVARDPGGASAISYTTWGLFAVSHLSTVAYAMLVVVDWRMASVFVANALCCLVIVGLTAWKRALFKAAQRLLESADAATLSCPGSGTPAERNSGWAMPGPATGCGGNAMTNIRTCDARGKDMHDPSLSRGAAFALVFASSSVLGSGGQAAEVARPSLSDACRAWREHIGELLDQHRLVQEMDGDTFVAVSRQYSSARDACSIGDFTAGLRLYEAIPLSRVPGASLR